MGLLGGDEAEIVSVDEGRLHLRVEFLLRFDERRDEPAAGKVVQEDRSDDPVPLEDELPEGAPVLPDGDLVLRGIGDIEADRHEVEAEQVEGVDAERSLVDPREPRHVAPRDAPLVVGDGENGDHPPLARLDLVSLGAVASGVDARNVRLHRPVGQDPPVDLDPASLQELDVGTHADSDDDQLGGDLLPVLEMDLLNLVLLVPYNPLDRRLGFENDSLLLQVLADDPSRLLVETQDQDAVGQLDDRHLERLVRSEPLDRREADQPPAQDHDVLHLPLLDPAHDLDGVLERRQIPDSLEITPFHRRVDRRPAGGDHQLVIGNRLAILEDDLPVRRVDARNRDAGTEIDVKPLEVVLGPVPELVPCFVAAHPVGDDRAAVREVPRLAGEDRDPAEAVVLADRLHRADPGVGRTDDDVMRAALHRPFLPLAGT